MKTFSHAACRLYELFALTMLMSTLSGCSGTNVTFGEPLEVRIGDDGSFAMLSRVEYCPDTDSTISRQRWIYYSTTDTQELIQHCAAADLRDTQGRCGFMGAFPARDYWDDRGIILEFDTDFPDSTDAALPDDLRKQLPAAVTTKMVHNAYGWSKIEERKAYLVKIDGVEYAMMTPWENDFLTGRYLTPGERSIKKAIIVVATSPAWIPLRVLTGGG